MPRSARSAPPRKRRPARRRSRCATPPSRIAAAVIALARRRRAPAEHDGRVAAARPLHEISSDPAGPHRHQRPPPPTINPGRRIHIRRHANGHWRAPRRADAQAQPAPHDHCERGCSRNARRHRAGYLAARRARPDRGRPSRQLWELSGRTFASIRCLAARSSPRGDERLRHAVLPRRSLSPVELATATPTPIPPGWSPAPSNATLRGRVFDVYAVGVAWAVGGSYRPAARPDRKGAGRCHVRRRGGATGLGLPDHAIPGPRGLITSPVAGRVSISPASLGMRGAWRSATGPPLYSSGNRMSTSYRHPGAGLRRPSF